MDKEKLAYFIAELMLQKKGTDIKILNLTDKTSITDYFVICSASVDVQVKSIADHIMRETRNKDEHVWRNEGYTGLSWVLLDFVDVVAHVFNEETRRFYNLEGLWGDAEIINITEETFAKKPAKKAVKTPRTVKTAKAVKTVKKK
jgi:ribosome-associated protein